MRCNQGSATARKFTSEGEVMKRYPSVLIAALIFVGTLGANGCATVGTAADRTGEVVGNATRGAGNVAGDAVEGTGDAINDTTRRAREEAR